MHVALIQQNIVVGDKEANYSNVAKLVENAVKATEKPDLIVLPELWSTGYALKKLGELSSEQGDEEAEFLGGLAKKHQVWFAGGSVAARTDQGITNRAQVINRQGELTAIYDKAHLVPMLLEDKYLIAGNKSCVHDIEGITFGFVICYDLRFCEFLRKLTLDGAQVLIVAAEWPLVRLSHWQTLLKARAIENQCYILAANNVAFGKAPFAGHSQILAPDGTTMASLEFQEGIIHSTLSDQAVNEARKAVPVFIDRRPELYS